MIYLGSTEIIISLTSQLPRLHRDLERLSSDAVRVLLYETREYTITMQVAASPSRKRQATTTTVTITRQEIVLSMQASCWDISILHRMTKVVCSFNANSERISLYLDSMMEQKQS